jgi:hypothetical protein
MMKLGAHFIISSHQISCVIAHHRINDQATINEAAREIKRYYRVVARGRHQWHRVNPEIYREKALLRGETAFTSKLSASVITGK